MTWGDRDGSTKSIVRRKKYVWTYRFWNYRQLYVLEFSALRRRKQERLLRLCQKYPTRHVVFGLGLESLLRISPKGDDGHLDNARCRLPHGRQDHDWKHENKTQNIKEINILGDVSFFIASRRIFESGLESGNKRWNSYQPSHLPDVFTLSNNSVGRSGWFSRGIRTQLCS